MTWTEIKNTFIERNLYKGMKKKKKNTVNSQLSTSRYTQIFQCFVRKNASPFFLNTSLSYNTDLFYQLFSFPNSILQCFIFILMNVYLQLFQFAWFFQVIGQFIMKKRKIADIFYYKRKSFCNFLILSPLKTYFTI